LCFSHELVVPRGITSNAGTGRRFVAEKKQENFFSFDYTVCPPVASKLSVAPVLDFPAAENASCDKIALNRKD
jgi:hypothetical protein